MEKVTVYEDYKQSPHFKWIHMKEFEATRWHADRFDELKQNRKIVTDGGESIKKMYGLVFLVSIIIGIVAFFYAWVAWPAIIAIIWMWLKLYLNGMYIRAWLHWDTLKEQIKNTRIEKENISLKLENKAMRDYMNEKVLNP